MSAISEEGVCYDLGGALHGMVWELRKVDGNINAVKYRDILDNHLWPVLARHFADKPYRFQDDNAPVHRARIIEEFKRDNDIHGMKWSAQFPDLNIIENLWLRIKTSLHKYSSRTVYCHSGYLDELYCGLHSELIYLYSTQDSGSYTVEVLPHKILR